MGMTQRAAQSLPTDYFERVYAANDDPWDFETSEYEREKYRATIDALPRASYERGLEIGCSIGVLTVMLAARCRRLLAIDVSDMALERARVRCASLTHVEFKKMSVPDEFPDEDFNLIVVSEVGYYWSRADLARAQELIVNHMSTGAHLLLVHWTPFVPDYPQTGDAVHESFLKFAREADGDSGLRHVRGERAEKYRLDLFERV